MKWRIVGFNHPEEEKSLLYWQNITTDELLEKLKVGIEKGCNLFSIRGFKDES